MKMTGYGDTQMDRLIARKVLVGSIVKQKRTQPTFVRIYTPEDIALLCEVDNAENRRTGAATKKTCRAMYLIYKDERFKRLANISVSHIYNLRGTRQYSTKSSVYTKTNPTSVAIGIRKVPRPEGKPGYLRVDSVHQGELANSRLGRRKTEKGVYHINLVDAVIQEEIVVTVEGISEEFLIPALEEAMNQFKVVIRGFQGQATNLLIRQTTGASISTNGQHDFSRNSLWSRPRAGVVIPTTTRS